MRHVKLAIAKTYNNKKKNHSKSNIPKNVFLEYVYITANHSFININFVIFFSYINIKVV
jgi:hypothetical protein